MPSWLITDFTTKDTTDISKEIILRENKIEFLRKIWNFIKQINIITILSSNKSMTFAIKMKLSQNSEITVFASTTASALHFEIDL